MKPSEIRVGMYFADESRRRRGNVYEVISRPSGRPYVKIRTVCGEAMSDSTRRMLKERLVKAPYRLVTNENELNEIEDAITRPPEPESSGLLIDTLTGDEPEDRDRAIA